MEIVSIVKSHFELVSLGIALIGAAVTLWWKFPDRNHQFLKDRLSILQSILDKPLKEQHDLVLESAFGSCFGITITAPEVRFLLNNPFSVVEIENLCKARDQLKWDELSESFQFSRWNRKPWFLWTKLISYTLLYAAIFCFAVYCIESVKLSIQYADKMSSGQILSVIMVEALMFAFSFFCLWRASSLYKAHRFMKCVYKITAPPNTMPTET